MNYLVTTKSGAVYSISDSKSTLLFSNNKRSIYTDDISFRFIRKIGDHYCYGRSEDILFFKDAWSFNLPGLVDIKDMAIGENFIAILSGARDSVYILNKELNQIHTCFNIGKNGNLEFFKERQVQCNEIPSNYFQIFYVPNMNNYHDFEKLKITKDGFLDIESKKRGFTINLNNFSIHEYVSAWKPYHLLEANFFNDKNRLPPDEIITDIIEC